MEFNNLRNTSKKNIALAVIISLLIFSNIFLSVKYFLQAKEIVSLKREIKDQQTNEKIAAFFSLFIQKVLKTDKEVSFEDRLQLENSIRSIDDSELLQKWEKFTGGTNETEIQSGVKDLLEILARKIIY